MKKPAHISETPATRWLRAQGVAFTEHPYAYVEHGGTAESARQLGVSGHEVVKTLVMQDEHAQPLIVLMHGDRQVSLKNLARQIGAKSVEPCRPEVAQRHSGYQVGGTSPFATRRTMPVWIEAGILALPRILINGGRRGYLVGIAPEVLERLTGAAGELRLVSRRFGRRPSTFVPSPPSWASPPSPPSRASAAPATATIATLPTARPTS